MAYLSKTERRKQILEIAMAMALDDGLNTLTVRNVAQKASLSVGLIHHHFESIQALKCEVFIQLAYKNLDINDINVDLSVTESILIALGFTESEAELPYIRLWNEAEQNSLTNVEFKKVYLIAIEEWHKLVKTILESASFKNSHENLDDMAWQLISLTLGLEGLKKFNFPLFNYQYMTKLVNDLITNKIKTNDK